MNKEELKERTKRFALETIKLVEKLPKSKTADVIGRQLLRSATSVGSNYRAVCRAKSQEDFIYKIRIVEEEIDESAYWIELVFGSGLVKKEQINNLFNEANELTSIFTAAGKTAKSKIQNRKSKIVNLKLYHVLRYSR